jgi:hypothetical protein
MAQPVKTLKILAQGVLQETSLGVISRSLSDNVATITTATEHDIKRGNVVNLSNIDSTFNGSFNVLDVTASNSFTYTLNSPNVLLESVSGSVSYVPPTEIYTAPSLAQTLISTISVTNVSESDGNFFLAVVKNGESLQDKHYIAWGPGILARDNISITIGLTMSDGDKIIAFGSPKISISLFGGEIV